MQRFVLNHSGQRIVLAEGVTVVGRGLHCDVRFNDPAVSREHMRIVVSGGRAVVVNLSQSNGTLLNRHKITRAQELHDEARQALTAMLVGLRAITDMAVPPEVRPVALRLREIAAHTMDDIGRLARGLHPAVLDDKELAAAARRYVGDYVRSFGINVDFVAGELDSPPLAPLAAATMYRILQETLTNVARHAHARKVAVELKRDESALELLVRDDGVGFDVRQARDGVSGLGLHGMRERVTLLGGSIQIESRPGEGTLVQARIPARTTPAQAKTRGRRRRGSPSPGSAS